MSAWMHGTDHIDLLVSAVREVGLKVPAEDIDPSTQRGADALGSMLLAENAASVNYRYDLDPKSAEARGYARQVKGYTFTPVDLDALVGWESGVLKATSSYAYQSCEHEGWGSSLARRIVDDLAVALIARGAHRAESLDWWDWSREKAGLETASA